MTHTPRISVLLAVYGDEPHISGTLASLKSQSYTDFEIIIATEDLSDATREALDNTPISITELEYEGHGGLSGALNAGLKCCEGEYIARIDADDIALPNRFETQISVMDSNPDIGVLGGGYEMIDKSGSVIGKRFLPESHAAIRWRLLLTNSIANPTTIIRRSILEKTGIKYQYKFNDAEDYDFWARLSRKTTIRNIQQPLIRYRMWDGQISQQKAGSQRQYGNIIAKREVKKSLPVSFSSEEIKDMRALLYQNRPLTSTRKHVSERCFRLFKEFQKENEGLEGMDEAQSNFALRLSRNILRPTLDINCIPHLAKLLWVDPKYPVNLIR